MADTSTRLFLKCLILAALFFALPQTGMSAPVSSRKLVNSPWDKISGPGSDDKCTGTCSTGAMVQTVQCGATRRGLMTLADANAMFCSNRAIDKNDEDVVKYNADQLEACFKAQPNTRQNRDQYEVFIHEMLCNWKACRKAPPRNLSVMTKSGVWTEYADGRIQMILCKPNVSNCSETKIFPDSTNEFGELLLSRNVNLCDLGMDEASVRSGNVAPQPNLTAPVVDSNQTSPRMPKKARGVSR